MNGKKIVSMMIVALFIASSAVAVLASASESSAAPSEYMAEYYPDGRYVYKIEGMTGEYWSTNGIPADDPDKIETADGLAESYVNGDISNFDAYPLYESISPNTRYYQYSTYTGPGDGSIVNIFKSEKVSTYVPLNAGTYTINIKSVEHDGVDISDSVRVTVYYYSGDTYPRNVSVELNKNIDFTFNTAGAFYFSIGSSDDVNATIRYELTPAPITERYSPTESHLIASDYHWCIGDVVIPSGTYVQIGYQEFVVISDPEKQVLFEEEIVKQNKVYRYRPGDENRYGTLYASYDRELELESDTPVKVYVLSNHQYDSIYLGKKVGTDVTYDNLRISLSQYASDGEERYRFYAAANSTFEISVDYDTKDCFVYLTHSGITNTKMIMLPGYLYHIDNDQAKTYELTVVKRGNVDSFESVANNVKVYVNGLPNSDSNVFIFAIICIGLCVAAFGLLIHSGKKPTWGRNVIKK